MAYAAKILIVSADTASAAELREGLSRLGFGGRTADSAEQAGRRLAERAADIVLIDAALPNALDFLRQLRGQASAATTPAAIYNAPADVAAWQPAVALGVDDIVEAGAGDAELAARLQPLGRIATMQAEFTQRVRTAQQFDVPAPRLPAPDSSPCQLLLADPAGGRDVAQMLNGAGTLAVETDAHRAELRLDASRFDAAVLMALPDAAAAMLHLAAQIRRNPKLFNLPVLMLGAASAVPDRLEAYRQGASLVRRWPDDAGRLRLNIDVLVQRQRRRWALREGLLATLTDGTASPVPGAYSAAFAKTHLARLIAPALAEQRPLSVLVVALQNLPSLQSEYGLPAGRMLRRQAADFIAGLVRAEDMIGLLGDDEFCAVLPNTAASDASVAVQRLAAVLNHTEFHLTEEVTHPIKLWANCGSAEVIAADTPDRLLARARQAAA